MKNQLTPEEEQFIRDIGDDGLWRYPAYATSVTASALLQKLTEQFYAVLSYVERFRDGRVPFEEQEGEVHEH